ncbi:MAG: SoxR reducing system RseC family protein [bacterium]
MKESGKVLRKIDLRLAEVEIRSTSACAKCGICHFNQAGTLSMEAENDIGASVGNIVEINIPEGQVILSSFLIFIFPILVFFTGYIIKGIMLGAVCLILYLIFLYFYDKKTKTIPKITRIV